MQINRIYSYASLSEEEFRRRTSVKRSTFLIMLNILKKARDAMRNPNGNGKPWALSLEKALLMGLEYLREYRTYFHIGTSYKVSETTAYRNCRWVEDTLIKDPQFHLPGKKTLREVMEGGEDNFLAIDVAESPIERPKKRAGLKTARTHKRGFTQEKRSDTH